jgi:hypothetical protein
VTFVAAGLGVAVVPEPVAELLVPGIAYRALTGRASVELAAATRTDDEAPQLKRALAVVTHLVQPHRESTRR